MRLSKIEYFQITIFNQKSPFLSENGILTKKHHFRLKIAILVKERQFSQKIPLLLFLTKITIFKFRIEDRHF